jgi:hypothetical protein
MAAPTATTSSGFTPCGVLPEELLHHLLDLRDPCRASDQDHLVDLRRRKAGVLQALPHRTHRLVEEVARELLELRARQLQRQVLRF